MASEEEEVRSLLMRHQKRIICELTETELVPVLVEKNVLTKSDEETIKQLADNFVGKCTVLVDLIAKNGFEKFKEFCYAIESECPQLIEDLINDRVNDNADNSLHDAKSEDTKSDTLQKNQNSSCRSSSYDGSSTANNDPKNSSSRCSSVDISSSSPLPPPPPIAEQKQQSPLITPAIIPFTNPRLTNQTNDCIPPSSPTYINHNLIVAHQKSLQQQEDYSNINNYSSLLCHQAPSSSSPQPAPVKKRDKLRYRLSDVGTWGRRKKDKFNRRFHSMNETIEMLADPVVEDNPLGDRSTWEYHTVSVTRVPGFGFGIAVSGGCDNPHFANGDPSIAVSDVLKGGPAEDRLQVNDRIISVNGVCLENVEYSTAVQVLRDSGNTVTLVVKRRVPNLNSMAVPNHVHHQHSHSLVSSTGLGGAATPAQQTIKLVLSKPNKKDDFGIVLGCRLFVKEISSRAREQLTLNGYTLQEGDIVTRIHNTNTNDSMSLKEAKKIIDGCKERLNMVVLRDIGSVQANTTANSSGGMQSIYSHTAQVSNCSNNDDAYLAGGSSYSTQNLYVQPPTRPALSTLLDDKSNLTPRGRSRNPLMDVSMLQLDLPSTPVAQQQQQMQQNNGVAGASAVPNIGSSGHSRSRSGIDEPPRPPPPREDFYSSRRQLYEDDPLQRSKQSQEPRFISFQKEGSVGIRLTGGNEAGIFVTAVQPGSPASLQGLTPGDKILKVNDMDMHEVTREEAVLFLLSLQERIDLIVQHCKDEYDNVVANQRGDSFHIKTHFHCTNPSKGEMTFKAGDVFRVVDTLHNGVVGSWQVLRVGRGHQEMQRGVIPNKSRAEELATAQFNATKKEMSASESRTSFFRRKRSNHRRSKSLSRENWDDVVFSDSISKFPAYERVVLRHPGFVRPVVLFGPVADLARDRLTKDFPDKFTVPLQDNEKANAKNAIVRLSNIRDIMDRGKHALLDITPNAVDRLNYAQFYPIVIFLKADTKHMIKQLRQGIPKSVHKSSKKLFEQCSKLDRVWSHIFSNVIVLSDVDTWYRKLRDNVDQLQSGAVWMSESKPVESLSDDFLFPMQTSRLSYASSPESDLELSPGPSASLSLGNLPQLVKSNSDPSIATNQDNLERDRELNIGDGMPPPYTNPFDHSGVHPRRATVDNKYTFPAEQNDRHGLDAAGFDGTTTNGTASLQIQPLYGIVPELPPRIDRASKPPGLPNDPITPTSRTSAPPGTSQSSGTVGRNFINKNGTELHADTQDEYAVTGVRSSHSMEKRLPAVGNGGGNVVGGESSLDRKQNSLNRTPSRTPNKANNGSSYDSVSSYDSMNTTQMSMQNLRLGPNAPDDLKSVPSGNGRTVNETVPPHMIHKHPGDSLSHRNSLHEHSRSLSGPNGMNIQNSPGKMPYMSGVDPRLSNPHENRPNIVHRQSNPGLDSTPPRKQHSHSVETKTDYGRYSRTNSASQADYTKSPKSPHVGPPPPPGGAFKPVPPPKPKNYRPPIQGAGQMNPNQWDNGEPMSPRSPNGFYYSSPQSSHYHSQNPSNNAMPPPSGAHHGPPPPTGHGYNQYNSNGNHYPPANQAPPYNGYNGNHSYGGQYMQHRSPAGLGNIPPHHPAERHALDLAGSREQRGSAFELYRKPQIGNAGHHHNISGMEPHYAMLANELNERHQYYNMMSPPPPPLPPPKPKNKFLKSPLVAIKNAFAKAKKPLRRQSSMVEPAELQNQRQQKSMMLRRQHSMVEQRIHYDMMTQHHQPRILSPEQQQYAAEYNQRVQEYLMSHEPFYPRNHNQSQNEDGTYQCLQSEAIYGNCGARNYYEQQQQQENVYANRALIELNQSASSDNRSNGGRRIVRRHSMADRTGAYHQNRKDSQQSRQEFDQHQQQHNQQHFQQDDIYQTRSGAFLLQHQSNIASANKTCGKPPLARGRSEDEPIYQSRREMHRNHLYQTKTEMQQRIHQGRIETADRSASESPIIDRSNNHRNVSMNYEIGGSDPLYQSRKELKEKGFRTRTELRDHIYQSRMEAMRSLAEPVYVSKKDAMRRDESSSSSDAGSGRKSGTPSRSVTFGKDDILNEEQPIQANSNSDVRRQNDENEKTDDVAADQQKPSNNVNDGGNDNDNDDDDDDTLTNANQSDLQKATSTNDDTVTSMKTPLSPRAQHAPFHISKIIKRTAPPPSMLPPTQMQNDSTGAVAKHVAASRTSLETQYTSQASLPISLPSGPPNAQSTPYASDGTLSGFPPPREQSTTRGVFDEHGGTLCDNIWNVSINIPKGAIPAGVQQEIYFTVTDPRLSQTIDGPPLDMENGETMLSPLVMCGPQGLEFLVPVTLNIPHCAGRTTSLGLALKATDSEKNLQTNWDNIELPTNAAAHTVSVKVDHF